MVSFLGCNQINSTKTEPHETLTMHCDSTLNTFNVIEWPKDSTIFSLPKYSYKSMKSLLQEKEVASLPWLSNGFGIDLSPEYLDGYEDMQYFKEGAIYKDSCQYVLIWAHDAGTHLSLFLCKVSKNCELLANERLAKSLWIPGLEISQSSVLKKSGNLSSTTLNIATEVDVGLANVPPDTIREERGTVLTCD